MVSIKELLVLTRQSCNTRERALGSLPANRAFNSDQVISLRAHDGERERAPGPGLKLQAAGVKLSNQPVQASGGKRQAPGSKLQASSHKLQAP